MLSTVNSTGVKDKRESSCTPYLVDEYVYYLKTSGKKYNQCSLEVLHVCCVVMTFINNDGLNNGGALFANVKLLSMDPSSADAGWTWGECTLLLVSVKMPI